MITPSFGLTATERVLPKLELDFITSALSTIIVGSKSEKRINMLPIVGALLSEGLNLLDNAVLAKGKEFVEEKTGLKLEPNMSEENILKLKQLATFKLRG